jgi:hypothetical protein
MKNFFNKIIKFAKGVAKMVKKLSADTIIKCEETIRKTVDNSDHIIETAKGMSKITKTSYFTAKMINDRIGFVCLFISGACFLNSYLIDKKYKLEGDLENE